MADRGPRTNPAVHQTPVCRGVGVGGVKKVCPVNLSLHLLYKRLERRFRKKNAGRSHRGDPNCEGETRGADRRRLAADAAPRADSAAPAAAAAAAQSIQATEAEREIEEWGGGRESWACNY